MFDRISSTSYSKAVRWVELAPHWDEAAEAQRGSAACQDHTARGSLAPHPLVPPVVDHSCLPVVASASTLILHWFKPKPKEQFCGLIPNWREG